MSTGHHEELGYIPCEAIRPPGSGREKFLTQKEGVQAFRRVLLCGRPARLYVNDERYVALCGEHKHLISGISDWELITNDDDR